MTEPGADYATWMRRMEQRKLRAHLLFGLLPSPRRQRLIYDHMFRDDNEAVSYHYARHHHHLPDFGAPRTLNEKVRWQFLHHPDPLMSLVADKIAVRGYLKYRGALIEPPRLIATGWRPEEIRDIDLPAEFALKASFSCGANHFQTSDTRLDRRGMERLIRRWYGMDQWRRFAELYYRDIPKRFLVEEYVPATRRALEYKVFCMHGEPAYISAIVHRGKSGITRNIHYPDWSLASFGTVGLKPSAEPIPRPEMLDFILSESRKLSQDMMHARVDFLHRDDQLVFSEITLSNAGARWPLAPEEKNREIGALIDLSQAPEYLVRGRRIAAELHWPPVPPPAG